MEIRGFEKKGDLINCKEDRHTNKLAEEMILNIIHATTKIQYSNSFKI